MLFFVYPNKCQTLWYETILHNKQNNKKSPSSPPFFSICTIGHNLGVTKAKKMRFCSPKNYRIFVREEEASSSRDVLLSTEKMENRETKVVIQSGLRLKLAFEVFWKFSCLFWHPLLTSSITLQCGRKRKSFVTHRWFKISLIELLDPEEGTTWCTQWSAETFAQKMLSVSPPNVPVKVLLFFNERKTPSLVLNVTKVYFLQSQLQFPWNKSRNYQGSARASFYQNPTGEDKKDILATLPPAAAGFYFFLLSRIIWTQKELFGKYRQPFW